MYKKKTGITLISLVLTIIILMILAGIVIATLSDEDKNVVDRSKEVKESLEIDQEKEILQKILIEIENKYFADTNSKILFMTDALTNEGVTDFEVFATSVRIKSREHNFSDLVPGFTSL